MQNLDSTVLHSVIQYCTVRGFEFALEVETTSCDLERSDWIGPHTRVAIGKIARTSQPHDNRPTKTDDKVSRNSRRYPQVLLQVANTGSDGFRSKACPDREEA